MRRMFRIAIVLAIMAVFATSAYAFTAANTVDSSSAGFGAGSVSGYGVSNIKYGLDVDNSLDDFGNRVETISFDLSGAHAPTQATLYVDQASGDPEIFLSTSNGCTMTGSGPWTVTCGIPTNTALYLAGISQLRVGAAQ